MTEPAFGPELRDAVATNLDQHPRLEVTDHELRHAAVAITIVPGDAGQAAFVLTRRSSRLRSHSNQYALPGGRLDEGEDAHGAARREVHEEIGIELTPGDVIGTLDDYVTRSGYVITPVVAWTDDLTRLAPAPGEVDAVMLIGLHELFRDDSPRWIEIPESDRPVLQLPLLNRLIHAPTGALLWQFREVAIAGELVRTDRVEEPTWAWR